MDGFKSTSSVFGSVLGGHVGGWLFRWLGEVRLDAFNGGVGGSYRNPLVRAVVES